MSSRYNVHEVGGVPQKIRIVGMTRKFTPEDLRDYLFACNVTILSKISECKILKIFPTKKNQNIFQAIEQVDKLVYDRALQAGNLFVGYDSCSVYDAFDVLRCFRCNEFNHGSRICKKPVSCPVCSGEHDLKDCKSNSKKCSNCVKLNNSGIAVDHAVWEKDKCSAYSDALNKIRSNVSAIK
jgi:hypothetical protein